MKAATRAAIGGRGAALRTASSPSAYAGGARVPNGGRGRSVKLEPEASSFRSTQTQAQSARGRGSILLQSHIQPSTQSTLPASGRGAGARSGAQTRFSSAVLRGRRSSSADSSFNGSGVSSARSQSHRTQRSAAARRARDALWLADDVRELATDALARTRADADAFLNARRAHPFLKEIPFQAADFTPVVSTLPDQHWASLYIGEVAHALTANPSMQPATKVSLLNEALGALRTCAETHQDHDIRFQDAEEDAQSVAVPAAAQY